ncbi:gp29 [Sphingomonas phage PAU]|uniref:gp29 n=1 Tax=Sphingomonas phage PAU TaxID=1150991 RepID=UPI0002573122|nr:gp29 [Sphingomonas phage PAU]AFF28027.1 gp29 [Sphingomonas phage PAU]
MSITKNTWSRHPKSSTTNYEFSSQGDKRFSPLFAKLRDGRTIEQAYQLDVKGHRIRTNDWLLAKGKPPLNDKTVAQLYSEFKELVIRFLKENMKLLKEFIEIAKRHENFIDRFATTEINQARAYSEIANELRNGSLTIELEPEPEDLYEATRTYERCVICNMETNLWHKETNTPICEFCAVLT